MHGGAEEADSDSEDEATDDVEPPKVLGDLLESLAGAIFMDSGMNLQAVWDTLGVLFTEKIGMCLDTEKIIIISACLDVRRATVALIKLYGADLQLHSVCGSSRLL